MGPIRIIHFVVPTQSWKTLRLVSKNSAERSVKINETNKQSATRASCVHDFFIHEGKVSYIKFIKIGLKKCCFPLLELEMKRSVRSGLTNQSKCIFQ